MLNRDVMSETVNFANDINFVEFLMLNRGGMAVRVPLPRHVDVEWPCQGKSEMIVAMNLLTALVTFLRLEAQGCRRTGH